MAVEITDKTYPIQQEWINKVTTIWGLCTGMPILVLYFTGKEPLFFCIFLSLLFTLGCYFLFRHVVRNFHYVFGEQSIILSQDLIIYKGEKTFLYGRIQNIYFFEGPLDKILGLASIVIETAAAGGGIARADAKNKISAFPMFGNNEIGIPGLPRDKALELKEFLMGRIKNNSINDAQSGL